MAENHDAGSPGFEERIRELFEEGATGRAVSANGVIEGARRRRIRHRATAAGSSLAVLGVVAGAIAFGAHTGLADSGQDVHPAAGAKTCSASLTGTVPATSTTTVDGLDFVTVSGKTAGFAWSIQIHNFPDQRAHVAWEELLPAGSIPQAVMVAGDPGAIAQFRTAGIKGYSESGAPEGQEHFTIQRGTGIGPGTPADPAKAQGSPKTAMAKHYPAYATAGWLIPHVDHLCAQYADHAEFLPVYRIQGGSFYVFGYKTDDPPQKVIGYSSAGKVVATGTFVTAGQDSLSAQR